LPLADLEHLNELVGIDVQSVLAADLLEVLAGGVEVDPVVMVGSEPRITFSSTVRLWASMKC
jgi:hypothetical protein